MFEAVTIGIILILRLFPETAAARLLHTYFVERPSAWLASRTRAQMIFAAFVVALVLAGREFVLLAGAMDAAIMFAWDASLFIDALIVTWTAASAARLKGMKQMILARWRGTRVRRPRVRAFRSRTTKPVARNDDEPEPGRIAA